MCLKNKKTLNDGATAVSKTNGEHIGWENQHVFYCFHGISLGLMAKNNIFLQLSWCSCRVWPCFWGDVREMGVLVASRLIYQEKGKQLCNKKETSTVRGCGYRFTFIYGKYLKRLSLYLNIIHIYTYICCWQFQFPFTKSFPDPNLTSSMCKKTPDIACGTRLWE